jgi:hypothetical protein
MAQPSWLAVDHRLSVPRQTKSDGVKKALMDRFDFTELLRAKDRSGQLHCPNLAVVRRNEQRKKEWEQTPLL